MSGNSDGFTVTDLRPPVVVLNPCAGGGRGAPAWALAKEILHRNGLAFEVIETRGDGHDLSRICDRIVSSQPSTVVAAGGDGTIRQVAEAFLALRVQSPMAMAVLPIGTANNLARSLGLRSCRATSSGAEAEALRIAIEGRVEDVDAGRVVDDAGTVRHFVGSFAVGMDADILATRNRLSSRLPISGYPLYLLSCALNLLRSHGTRAQLEVDGVMNSLRLYQLLITNAPIYAGEFRFDAKSDPDDGWLDLLRLSGREYVVACVSAWRRHVRYSRGDRVAASPHLRRVRCVRIMLDQCVAAQIDGEELDGSRFWQVTVVPRILPIRVAGSARPK